LNADNVRKRECGWDGAVPLLSQHLGDWGRRIMSSRPAWATQQDPVSKSTEGREGGRHGGKEGGEKEGPCRRTAVKREGGETRNRLMNVHFWVN
jgi:hypothetical protein